MEEMKAQFTNIYVKNLDPEVSQEEFVQLFEQFGNVTSAVIQTDDEGRSRGFGFVSYQTPDQGSYDRCLLHICVSLTRSHSCCSHERHERRHTRHKTASRPPA